jgi:hypothetical protein
VILISDGMYTTSLDTWNYSANTEATHCLSSPGQIFGFLSSAIDRELLCPNRLEGMLSAAGLLMKSS